MKKIANRDASKYTSELKEFKGNNTFAEDHIDYYVVYSYGTHFPMYVYDKLQNNWIENTDKRSVSTSKHMGQCRPVYHVDYEKYNYQMSTSELKKLIHRLESK